MYEDIIIHNSVKKQFDLSGKSAIITGGAGFLGIQFAEAISEMGGYPLLIDINKKGLVAAEKKLKNAGFVNRESPAMSAGQSGGLSLCTSVPSSNFQTTKYF